ncbi:MAG: hypothetical protein L3J02_06650 [Henriciella sp.]|nr:hypothetical protein [Henriciella sp.]
MADGATHLHLSSDITAVDLETGISMIEAGNASETLLVDLGEGSFARADGRLGLQGLLQRLRGHRALMTMALNGGSDSVLPMRSGNPDMHPDVAVILDALKT